MSAAHGGAGGDRWFTPPEVIEMVTAFLGRIDLDPFSELQANTIVQARNIFTVEDDPGALDREWFGTVFVNPPGGKQRLTQKAWRKLYEEYAAGRVKAAAYLSFSLDTVQTTQNHTTGGILIFPTFIWRKRFTYWKPSTHGPVNSDCAMRPSCLTILPEHGADWTAAARAMVDWTRANNIEGEWVQRIV